MTGSSRRAQTSRTDGEDGLAALPPPSSAAPRPRRRRRRAPVGAYICLVLLAAVFLLPLLFLLNTALKSDADFLADPVGIVTEPRLQNFVDAWVQGHFGSYILNSIVYTLGGAGIGTVITMLVGFPVARGYIAGGRIWPIVFALLLFLPNSLITQFQLLLRLGLYDSRLGYVLMVAVGVGVGPLLFTGFVKSLPIELDEAAAIDGCGYGRYLVSFALPLCRPALTTIFILQAVWIWNEIILATVLLADQEKFPITVGLFAFKGAYSNQWGLLAAATMIVAVPLVVGYIFIQRYLVNGVLGAVKG
ncbi:MAG: carbohydrate ABC transporter permease [Brachybacterium tyrofermentans]|uniref:carbohydrate ABC transporter permease n=1 Tax=Brachybacterium tyrofermentans TaxID=47848 RepID=UPI0018663418|nr:carbohydrate ABC transporter permease [Brachybacterium tyrofermentans]